MTIGCAEPVAIPPPSEHLLSDADFRRLAEIVKSVSGITMPDSKRQLVHSRLLRRLRALRIPSFSDYVKLIDSPEGTDEREELLIAITTNVTSFFREKHHFETLLDPVLPRLVARARSGGRVRLWSAACSSGEEPYSMALCLLGACPEAARLDIRILATDIDRKVLSRAEEGTYPAEAIANVPQALAGTHAIKDRTTNRVHMSEGLKSLITFKRLNLLEPWPFKGPFDVIFCRNVVIYFDRATQEALWPRFHQALGPEGYLMIGHSEHVSGPAEATFRATGVTTYQKA